jgi:hypothetical protein
MVTKKFDYDTFLENDPPSRKVLISFLDDKGVDCYPDPMGIYGIDIKGIIKPNTSGSRVVFYDCEVLSGWKSGEFPWTNIHILGRKKKFVHPNVYFCSFRSDLKAFMLVPAYLCTKERWQMVMNSSVSVGEYMYVIPAELCKFVEIN